MTHYFCKTCGGSLALENGVWLCKHCGNVYKDESVKKEEEMLRSLFDETKAEKVSNLRRALYDAINEKYIDSEEICRICTEIKKLLPDDFMASFYYTANRGTPKEICHAIRDIDADEQAVYVEDIVLHMIRSLRSEYTLPLQNLVERRFKNADIAKYEELSTLISQEADKVSAGIYETSVPRDVFIAYSSKDMSKVEELVEVLEEGCLDCFVAARNLRHGRGARQNYEIALHEAMGNCRCVVFVSSQNSRSMECDALKVELKYIKTQDVLNAPSEYKNNYAAMPSQYKKPRIEYRIDNEKSQAIAERILKEFFSGLEYAYSPNEILDRIYNLDEAIPEPAEPVNNSANVKYCSACGAEVPAQSKFCLECGNSKFANTYAEYQLSKELDALRKQIEKSKEQEEVEEARRAEEERKAEEARLAKDEEREEYARRADASIPYLSFEETDDGYSVKIKNKDDCWGEIVIPESYNGKKVTSIGWGGFDYCRRLTSITIPDSVTSIGYGAFSDCTSLTSITIPDSVTSIGDRAFCRCLSLTSITIPEGVASIGKYAFYECSYLKSIIIPDSVTSIGYSAFSDCTSLTSITIPNSVTSVGGWAFTGCSNLIIITIPDNVTSIGEVAFSGCSSLASIIISDSVTSIGLQAFCACSSLTSINFSGTQYQWYAIDKGSGWNLNCPTITVHCTDGTITEKCE